MRNWNKRGVGIPSVLILIHVILVIVQFTDIRIHASAHDGALYEMMFWSAWNLSPDFLAVCALVWSKETGARPARFWGVFAGAAAQALVGLWGFVGAGIRPRGDDALIILVAPVAQFGAEIFIGFAVAAALSIWLHATRIKQKPS